MMRAVALMLVMMIGLPVRGDDAGGERWYIVQMQGKRCGWMHEQEKKDGENWRNESELKLEIKRGSITVTISVESSFVETADFKPVSMSSRMMMGAMPQGKRYRFGPDGVEVVETVLGQKEGKPTKEPLPDGQWLTPRAVERLSAEKIAAGEKEIVVRTIDPSIGLKPITATSKLLEQTTLEVIGKTVPAYKWESKIDLYPTISTTTFTDERARPLRNETDLGGIKLTIVRADRDLAMAKVEPPELLLSTLITPDQAIAKPRTLSKAVYTIESTGDSLADIPTEGGQRFERIGPKSGRLIVDAKTAGRACAPQAEVKDAGFSDCTTMVTCGDAEVKAALGKALGADAPKDRAARAETLRKFVFNYIDKKSLDVGFATAAEVARTKSGDCSEHGVLLCALLRADHIPARVVAGVVYVDEFAGKSGIFGYHMWTQALLDDGSGPKWVDLDAALSRESGFDATHIALTTSSLSENEMTNSLVQLAPLMGTIKIKVESAE
ncbi:MAG: transglutaminase domain-containing protein [Phycisphaerales bacterium]|nr:transglutaminase domain-containing protein [Phycisphaerales bacterium]